MTRALILRRVILPKAFRLALPAYTNEVIFLFQATSLVSIITIMDLTGVARDHRRELPHLRGLDLRRPLLPGDVLRHLYVFKSLEYRLSGHLRAGPTIKAAPAEEPRGTLTTVPWCRGLDYRCGATARVHDGSSARFAARLSYFRAFHASSLTPVVKQRVCSNSRPCVGTRWS